MKYLKILGLLAVVITALMANVDTAFAVEETDLCSVTATPCPEGSRYGTGTVWHAESEEGGGVANRR